MKYICKSCDTAAEANDIDEIVQMGKLCPSCNSEVNRVSLVKTTHKKHHGKTRLGIKKSRKYTFVCNNCGTDAERNYKPWMCSECNKNSFHRVILK